GKLVEPETMRKYPIDKDLTRLPNDTKILPSPREQSRKKNLELLEELEENYYEAEGEIEFEPGPEKETETGESSKGKEVEKPPKKYVEKPERIEKPEISKEEEKLLKDYRRELKDLGRSNDIEDFINSSYAELYPEEQAELI
ncbi:28278_t:CDS:2, partial [Racocetra persica]